MPGQRWAVCLVAAALAGCPVLVQGQEFPAATPPQSVAPPTPEAGPQDIGDPGVWRLSDLLRQDVYRPNAGSLGSVDDIILSRDGHVEWFVVALRNNLGVTTRRVAVSLAAVQIVPSKTTATSGTIGGLRPSTETGARARADLRINNVVTPAGIVLLVSENEFQPAPSFEEGRRTTRSATPADASRR